MNAAPTYPPRGLNREEAARYIGVGATKFDEMVATPSSIQNRMLLAPISARIQASGRDIMRRVLEIISIAICIFLTPAPGLAQTATSTATLVMITFVNNANPPGLATTTQTVIGRDYTDCDASAKKATGIIPDRNTLQTTDMMRLYFICIPNK
jgi:hypothetical protein